MKYKIINKGSPIDYENEIHSLTNFAKERFGFEKPPSFVMQDDPGNASKLLGKTGYYDPNSMQIHVFTTGRHPKDILRSIAHELVHHMQHDKGELDHSGYVGQGYAQKNPHLRDMERQAYEMGNLCFRDWEDGLKQEQPTIYNERRNRKMSLKEWKNKELSQNLTEKWGFKMDLSKLNEGKPPKQLEPFVKKKQEDKDEDSEEDSEEKENSEESDDKPKSKKMPMKDEPKGKDLNKDGKKGHGKVPAFLDETSTANVAGHVDPRNRRHK
jgi:hypothetical protein